MTKKQLKNIIKESIKNVLMEQSISDVNSIDISKIDINILKNSYVDLRLVPTLTTYGGRLSILTTIKEEYGDIMPPDNVVNEILTKYHLDSKMIIKVESYNVIYVYIIIACVGKNDEIIEKDMKKMGYFLGCKGSVQEIQGMKFQTLQFEPYSQLQNNETYNIKNKYNCLYHWTPEYNLTKILKYGLKPNNKNKIFTYPPRIYLMKGDSSLTQMVELGEKLCEVNNNENNNGIYALLKIDIINIDDSIKFYFDSNSIIGIFTEQSIPPKNISLIRKYNFKSDN